MNDTDKIKSRAVKDFEVKFKSDYANSGLMEVYKRDLLERYKVFLRETLDKVAEAAEFDLENLQYQTGFTAGKQAAVTDLKAKRGTIEKILWAAYEPDMSPNMEEVVDDIFALLDNPTDRCEHGVHGTDCFKCHPVEGKCCSGGMVLHAAMGCDCPCHA